MRHDLESGAWIEMIPLGDLKGKDRDRYELAVRQQVPLDSEGEVDINAAVAARLDWREIRRNAAMACFVTAWSFTTAEGGPLPVPGLDDRGAPARPDVIGEYPLDDELEIEALIAPYTAKLRRPDPKETTTSSSNGRSPARAGSRKG